MGGGSCIFVKDVLRTRQIHYLRGLGDEETFEPWAVELLDIKLATVCIYRSPESDIDEFLGKLDSVIKIIQEHKKGSLSLGIGM
jgi:hypothetical protein